MGAASDLLSNIQENISAIYRKYFDVFINKIYEWNLFL